MDIAVSAQLKHPAGPSEDVKPVSGHRASWTYRLPRAAASVPTARALVEEICGDFRMPIRVTETAVLLTSEVMSNAVLHGAGATTLTIEVRPGRLRVSVHDEGEGAPHVQRRLPPDADHGRGVFLVEALASRWGADRRSPVGKTVWFELDRA